MFPQALTDNCGHRVKEDEITMSNLQQDKQQFLEKALKNYLLCLKTGVIRDDVIVM